MREVPCAAIKAVSIAERYGAAAVQTWYGIYFASHMTNGFYIAGLGASAGGLDALKDFFSNVSAELNTAFVVVTHLPKNSPTYLHMILAKNTTLSVHLISKTVRVQPNYIYILPGHLRIKIIDGLLLVRSREPSEIVNDAIDELLCSLAEDQKQMSIAIILSGMGRDGAKGAKAVHEQGGIVLVQNPQSTEFRSMPLATIEEDHPNKVLSPSGLARALNQILPLKGKLSV